MGAMTKNLTPNQRVWAYGILVCLSGSLFGGDTGSIGSITTMPQFLDHFGELSEFMRGLVVSVILVCPPFPVQTSDPTNHSPHAILAGKLMDKISRKYTISLGCAIGEGLFLSAATCYLCEIGPRHMRARLIGLFQAFITGPIAAGYFVCYGSIKIQSDLSWRLPFALATLVASTVAVGAPFLPYSPRWLMSHGRKEEAEAVLDLVTGPEDESERKELLAVPPSNKSGWADMFAKGVRGRTLLGTHLNVSIDFVLFYASLLFTQAGLDPATSSFIASGVTGLAVWAGTFVGAFYFLDNFGRRTIIIGGGTVVSACLLIIGSLYASGANHTPGGKWTIIILIEVYAVVFAATWATVTRLYASEIQPSKTRAAASSFGQGANQLVNTIVALTSPAFLAASSFGPYFLYGGLMLFGTAVAFLCMPETKGQSLENIDSVFEKRPVSVSWPSILKPREQDAAMEELQEHPHYLSIGFSVTPGASMSRRTSRQTGGRRSAVTSARTSRACSMVDLGKEEQGLELPTEQASTFWGWLENNRRRIREIMRRKRFHLIMILLVAVDLMVVMVELILALLTAGCATEELYHWLTHALEETHLRPRDFACTLAPSAAREGLEQTIFSINVFLLSLFTIEVFTAIYAFGPITYCTSWVSVLDGCVVIVTLCLDVFFHLSKDPAAKSPIALVILRLWKIFRAVHAIAHALELHYQEVVETAVAGRNKLEWERISESIRLNYVRKALIKSSGRDVDPYDVEEEVKRELLVLQHRRREEVAEAEREAHQAPACISRGRKWVANLKLFTGP
ncbi:MFS sugar transporter [Pseudohyphozyma bogoriensis]|nr:MFS sugar transporter [Pseudohyphozyma bogoriensis]